MRFIKYILLFCVFLNAQTILFDGLEYKVIKSPITGKEWLDRNMGALQACQSLEDESCFGDYYQWGRKTNGHEKLANEMSSKKRLEKDLDTNGKYIVVKKSSTFDWRIEQDDNLWKDESSKNNICPKGFRIPTELEIKTETVEAKDSHKVVDNKTAYNNFLKIPSSGFRTLCLGDVVRQGRHGSLWTSSSYERESFYLDFNPTEAVMTTGARAEGLPVRCIKN